MIFTAVSRLSESWNGIRREGDGYYIETCYSLYADMEDASAQAYLCLNGFSLYAATEEALDGVLPANISIQIDNGDVHTFYADSTIRAGAYSPSGNWMQYFTHITSLEHLDIPENEATFVIHVTVTPDYGEALSFTESASGPIANSLTPPAAMVTGRVYEFVTSHTVPADSTHSNTASLVWFPQVLGMYTTQIFEYGYIDPYTKVENASAGFHSIFFAVPNRDNIPEDYAAAATSNATVSLSTRYLSADFTGGILISECLASVPISPRDDVDASLKPVLTSSLITLSAAPSEAVINSKYVHRQARITMTPAAQFQYGDTLAYINTDGQNSYASSVSFQAEGVTPGETYTRPDTGSQETAGDESVRSKTMYVVGGKWRLPSAEVTVTYPVLYYHAPRIPTFNIHRCVVSSTSTDYRYNGTYYKKDDYGTYLLIEYETDFSALDNGNQISMIIQYGTHRVNITPSYSGSGFLVVSVGTAAMDVIAMLYDTFYPYGVAAKLRLSVNSVLLDFLAGGKGMAVGKNATEANALDISSSWKLLFYQATVGAYNGNTEQDLVAWMHDIDDRLDALENSDSAN